MVTNLKVGILIHRVLSFLCNGLRNFVLVCKMDFIKMNVRFIVLVYPPDRIWRWAGKPCPNRRKRGGRKVFYKSIYRGDEHISVSPILIDS